MEFGAFVNFFGKRDGLVHISQLSEERVEKVTDVDVLSGVVTVTCAFQPGPNNNSDIQVGVGTTATIDTYWGKYSWGKIYGYQNRSQGLPQSFFEIGRAHV